VSCRACRIIFRIASGETEEAKSVCTHLVVDLFVKVLDEDVALTGLAKRRVALRPHDAAM
jgi:hypothetical protein